jgi:hypothetical protein
MGIYSNGNIFGIRIYNFNHEETSNILYEKKYQDIMNNEQMREAYLFYNQLNDKNNIFFNFYTECTSTLDYCNKANFYEWVPMSLSIFTEKFNI